MTTRRPVAFALTLAGTASAMGALWPNQSQLAELKLKAANTPDERVRALEARLALSPDNAVLQRRLAEGYADAGRPEAGLALLERESHQRALDREELALARRLALQLGKPSRALALQLGPHARRRTGELTSLVDLALMSGDVATARRLQAELVAARPHDDGAIARARDLAVMAADLPAAIAAQQQLLTNHPGQVAADRLVSLYLQANDPLGALNTLERTPPDGNRTAWHHRAAQLAEWGNQPARAVPHLRALYEEHHDAGIGRRLLAALSTSGGANATTFAVQLAQDHPEDASMRRDAAYRLVTAGHPHDALALLDDAITRRPDDQATHDALVDFALGQGLQDAAIAELGRWVAQQPRDMVALRRLAEVLSWQGRMQEAWEVYERLFATCNPPADVARGWRQAWLAISTPALDQTAPGRANLAALATLVPENPEYARRLATACWAAGDRAGAIAALRTVVEGEHGTPEDVVRLGGWLLASGDEAEGLKLLRRPDLAGSVPPAVMADAAYDAARGARWEEAGYFFGRLAASHPDDPKRWEELSTALEGSGDLLGAAQAWSRRLALAPADTAARARYVFLLRRAARDREALAYFMTQPFDQLDPQTLASGAELARGQGDAGTEERALRALLAQHGRDAAARLRLVELLDARGAHLQADAMAESALALAPDDRHALYVAAARRVYGGRPEGALPLILRLANLPEQDASSLSLIADFYEPRDAERAARALDRLHVLTGGTPASWLRRGDLARRLGDMVGAHRDWDRAIVLATPPGDDSTKLGVRARALSRLGRDDDAARAWEDLAKRAPDDVSAAIAIARHHIETGAPARAEDQVRHALALAPRDPQVKLLEADWLSASNHPREARTAALEALALDPGLANATLSLRQGGAVQPRIFVRSEHAGLLDRQELGLAAEAPLVGGLRGNLSLAQQTWGGAASPSQELSLGASQALGEFTLEGRAGLVQQDGGVQSPLLHAGARWAGTNLSAAVEAAEDRWVDTPAAVQQSGRERHALAEVAWTPWAPLGLRGRVGAGRLLLNGQDVGLSTEGLAEAAWHPDAAWPLTLAYQFTHRGWGDAGQLVGLPGASDVHSALARLDATVGPLKFQLTPGYALDAVTGAGAPTVAGSIKYQPTPDAELSLSGAAAGRSFDLGLPDVYRQVELNARIFF